MSRRWWAGESGRRGLVAILFLALIVAVTPVASALAAPPTPQAEMTGDDEPTNADQALSRLQRLYHIELRVLERQKRQLERARKISDRVQTFAENRSAEGKDTSGLEAALVEVQAALEIAQGHHDAAVAILDAHLGFDAGGVVADQVQARETLREAGKAEREFYRALRTAGNQLRIGIRQYRQANTA